MNRHFFANFRRTGLMLGVAIAFVAVAMYGVPRSSLACPPSFAPAETFDLVLDSLLIDGEFVSPDSTFADTVKIQAAHDSQFDVFGPSLIGRYERQ